MSIIPLTYALSFIVAVVILWRFRCTRWYWHLAAVLLALAAGLTPQIEGWEGMAYDIASGCLFIFLFVWGAGAVLRPVLRNAAPRQ